jgi:acetyl-CoA decarbonylase/synthase complex subunit delta
MPLISASPDSLTVKEVRDAAPGALQESALSWEFHGAFPAAVAGADIVCVRHPLSVKRLRDAFSGLAAAGDREEGAEEVPRHGSQGA